MCSSGHRAAASRRRSPRRTPAALAVAEQAITRFAKVTATGSVADWPAAAAAATAGQSMHQIASTLEEAIRVNRFALDQSTVRTG